MKQAAFIGAGNMGGALIQAACRAIGPEEVLLCDPDREKAEALAQSLGCTAVRENAEAVRGARYVFLCVKPQVLRGVVEALAPELSECRPVLVSIAAGVEIATLRSWLPEETLPVLRVMPNTCAAIGQGMLALTAEAGTAEEYWAGVETILAGAGRIARIAEGQMDQFTAVAGCGPAYVDLFLEALADGGVLIGLPRQQAQIYAAQMVLGAAAMVLESGTHPGVLKDAVCSPGGSTIAGVAALEENGFRSAVIQAVAAAFEKNRQLGKH